RNVLETLAQRVGFDYEVVVLGISVAALMHVNWIRRKLTVPPNISRVIVPGWCGGDLDVLATQFQTVFERGPEDLFDLPEFFGRSGRTMPLLEDRSIEILAEINHAPHLSDDERIRQADAYRTSGADIIDLGCIPGERWTKIADAVKHLRENGFRVSVDSFERF